MRCFYHEDREAVGICKSCGRGLCRECAVELPKSLACRGRCEADAQAVTQLIERNLQVSATSTRLVQTSRVSRIGLGLFSIALGIIMFVGGLRDQLSIVEFLGVGMIAFGVFWLFLAGSLARKP